VTSSWSFILQLRRSYAQSALQQLQQECG